MSFLMWDKIKETWERNKNMEIKVPQRQLDRPQQFKMPEGYDFSARGTNFKEFQKYYLLRTDAVWQKYKLKDFFRSFYKYFLFNKYNNRYEIKDQEEPYYDLKQPQYFQHSMLSRFDGYSRSGATTSFGLMLGPNQTSKVSYQQYFSMPDYYLLCSLRFQKWAKCQSQIEDMPLQDKVMNYPCYQEYYETNYACSDDMVEHLLQLQYVKSQGRDPEQLQSFNISHEPTRYDQPSRPQKRQFTY